MKMTKSRIWLCQDCKRRYQRPRRLLRPGGVVTGECWACGGRLQRVLEPLTDNVFKGKPLWRTLLRKPSQVSP